LNNRSGCPAIPGQELKTGQAAVFFTKFRIILYGLTAKITKTIILTFFLRSIARPAILADAVFFLHCPVT
jgi:hypothetical protein